MSVKRKSMNSGKEVSCNIQKVSLFLYMYRLLLLPVKCPVRVATPALHDEPDLRFKRGAVTRGVLRATFVLINADLLTLSVIHKRM